MEPLIGQVIYFAGNFIPRGWALCDGRILAIENNTALYAVIGNKYGGDGVSTFALPDLRFQKSSSSEKEKPFNQLLPIIAVVGSYPSQNKNINNPN